MTIGLILAVLVGTVGAAFVAGLSGFAFGMIGLSVWAWVLEPRLLSPMVVFGSLVAQLVSLGAVRRGHSWRRLLPFLIGGIAGVPLGVRLLGVIDLRWFRGFTGAVLIFYQRISEAAFRRLVLGLLLVSGCVLVGSSLVG